MTPEEKAHFKEVYARQQIGYAKIQEMRDEDLRTTITQEAILELADAFNAAISTLPARLESGLVQYYQALSRSK